MEKRGKRERVREEGKEDGGREGNLMAFWGTLAIFQMQLS